MRAKVRHYKADGTVERESFISTQDMQDEIEAILIWAMTDKVTIHHKNASYSIYGPMEYECERCDEYGHTAENCPFTDDDLFVPDTEEEKAERMAWFNAHRQEKPDPD